MAGGIRDGVGEDGRIKHEHRSRYSGHAAGHHHEHFRARQFCQIRPDEQRRLDLADENIGRRRQPHRAADVERLFQHPRKAAHDRRHDAPIEQQRRQHAHHQHDGQRLKAENEVGARRLELERQRPAADIAEHERRAGPGRGGDGIDRVIDQREHHLDLRHLEHDEREEEGDAEPDAGLPPIHRAAVLADEPGEGEDGEDAEGGLEVEHCGGYGPGLLKLDSLDCALSAGFVRDLATGVKFAKIHPMRLPESGIRRRRLSNTTPTSRRLTSSRRHRITDPDRIGAATGRTMPMAMGTGAAIGAGERRA